MLALIPCPAVASCWVTSAGAPCPGGQALSARGERAARLGAQAGAEDAGAEGTYLGEAELSDTTCLEKKKSSLLLVGWARETAAERGSRSCAGLLSSSAPCQRAAAAAVGGQHPRPRPAGHLHGPAGGEERRREETSRSWEPRSTTHGSPEPQRARAGGRHQSRGSSGLKRWEKQRTTHF